MRLAVIWLGILVATGCGLAEHNVPEQRPSALPPQGPGPPSVDIAGTRVPRERAVVLLHVGHSNMMGFAVDPPELQKDFYTPHPRLWVYRGNGAFVPATEPTATRRALVAAGPGMALLRAAAANAPTDFHFISVGLGVSAATTIDFSKGGLYHDAFLAPARELKGRVTFGGVFLMFGNTDRHLPHVEQARFAERMQQLAADVRAALDEPELPFLPGDYEREATGAWHPDGPIGRVIRPQIESLPARIPLCALIPTTGLPMQDDHHFNLAGHKLWSERAMGILFDRGWARWPQAR